MWALKNWCVTKVAHCIDANTLFFQIALPHGAVGWSAVYDSDIFPDHAHVLLFGKWPSSEIILMKAICRKFENRVCYYLEIFIDYCVFPMGIFFLPERS